MKHNYDFGDILGQLNIEYSLALILLQVIDCHNLGSWLAPYSKRYKQTQHTLSE